MTVPPERAAPPDAAAQGRNPAQRGARVPSGFPAAGSLGSGPHAQFFTGAWSLVRGASFVWRTPAAWLPAAVPVALCALLCVVALLASIHFVPIALTRIWPDYVVDLGRTGAAIVRVIGIVVAAICGALLAGFATPPLSGPALERLILLRERDLGVAPRPAAGFWRELVCALKSQLLATAVCGPLLVVLWAITLLLPAAGLVTVPLKLLALALLLAWTLLDYPMSLRGVPLRTRVALALGGAPFVLGFGFALALVFAVPFMPLLALPIAVSAAAEVSLLLEQRATARSARATLPPV